MRHVLLLCLIILLAGCTSTTGQSSATANETPETVHAAWIAALQANDRAALLNVTGDLGGVESQAIFVDGTLRQMRGMLDPKLPPGGLVRIQQFAPQTNGAERLGLSLWTFAKTKRCYQARMVANNSQWKVISWNEKPACPSA